MLHTEYLPALEPERRAGIQKCETKVADAYGRLITLRRTSSELISGGDPTPVVIANGWGEDRFVMDWTACNLALMGREVWTFDHRRTGLPGEYAEERKITTVDAVVRGVSDISGNKIDLICNSEGALNGTSSAKRLLMCKEDRIRSIVLAQPASLVGVENPLALIQRIAKELLHQPLILKDLGKAAVHLISYSAHPRTVYQEVTDICSYQIAGDIVWLMKQGVPVGVIASEHDNFFPVERIKESLDMYCGDNMPLLEVVDSNHTGMIFDYHVIKAVNDMSLQLANRGPTHPPMYAA